MKYQVAKKNLQYALKNQKTISILKLNKILQSMNISLEPTDNKKIRYLKNEIKKKDKALKFYADKRNYGNRGEYWCIVNDEGRTARKALGEEIK